MDRPTASGLGPPENALSAGCTAIGKLCSKSPSDLSLRIRATQLKSDYSSSFRRSCFMVPARQTKVYNDASYLGGTLELTVSVVR